jgi:hypothetical protein
MAYFVGLDLGQSADYTALAVVQTAWETVPDEGKRRKYLHLRHLERYPLRTPYTEIADGVRALLTGPPFTEDEYDPTRHRIAKPKVELLVDKTGVGVAVTDLLKERRLRFTPVTIHGGEKLTRNKGTYNVPKGDLVAALEVPFHTGALKVAEGLKLWGVLREELQNFRRKINLKTAYTSYEHWREGDHDDLVLACALACWGATARRGSGALRLLNAQQAARYGI